MIDNEPSRNVLVFYGNPIGQLSLGGPGYSSRSVKLKLQTGVRPVYY